MARKRTRPLIEHRNGRPVILHDGEPVAQAAYCDYILRGDWEERNREFAANGVKVFYLTVPHTGENYFDSPFWSDDEVYPESEKRDYEFSLANQARMILAMQKEAKFYIRTWVSPPLAWTRKHPDHVQTDEDGQTHREASHASELLLAGLRRMLGNMVRYCESQPWGERVVGYLPAPFGEGLTPLTIAGKMFDCSPVNEAAFRAWVGREYQTEGALREAWGDATIRFEDVRIPRDRQWLAKRAAGPATLDGQRPDDASIASNSGTKPRGLFHWIEPVNAAPELAYCRFQREMFMHWVRTITGSIKETCRELGRQRLVGLDITKQPLQGWQIQLSFDGIGDGQNAPNLLTLSGSWDVGELLDDENLDVIFTPADYHARTVGFAYEAEGLSDSLLLRGKAMLIENDARCYVGAGVRDQGAFRNDQEVKAGLLRNAALTLSRGLQSYWCNVGSSYFHAPGIQKTIGQIVPMLDQLNEHPHQETRDAIAFVIDDQSAVYEDFTSGYQSLAVIWQRIRGLAHCGVPYRLFLLSDLNRANLPDYKVWFFPNLFRVDDQVLATLRKKVLRDGNVAIFGPGTGITDGHRLNAHGASELLGVSMELAPRTTQRHVIVQDQGHAITRELPASLTYGDSLPYGPTLLPGEWAVENAGGVPLGHANTCWFLHRTGLFVKEFSRGAAGHGQRGPRGKNDYAVMWSCAMPLPANLLRAIARYAGCHIWCEEDDVVYASESIAALHSVKAGRRVLKLPRAMRVYDAVTGKAVGRGRTRAIEFKVRPPQTNVYRLE